jgi:hypothetical protein
MDINYHWPEDWQKMVPENLLGAKHVFADGDSIEIVSVKLRDFDGGISPFVSYQIQQGPGIPRKLVMEFNEFIKTYGHLFPDVFK